MVKFIRTVDPLEKETPQVLVKTATKVESSEQSCLDVWIDISKSVCHSHS